MESYFKMDIRKIENIQRCFTKAIMYNSYTQRIIKYLLSLNNSRALRGTVWVSLAAECLATRLQLPNL